MNARQRGDAHVYPCARCCGTGVLIQFSHHRGGRCFACDGLGVVSSATKAANKERFRQRAIRRREIREALERLKIAGERQV